MSDIHWCQQHSALHSVVGQVPGLSSTVSRVAVLAEGVISPASALRPQAATTALRPAKSEALCVCAVGLKSHAPLDGCGCGVKEPSGASVSRLHHSEQIDGWRGWFLPHKLRLGSVELPA